MGQENYSTASLNTEATAERQKGKSMEAPVDGVEAASRDRTSGEPTDRGNDDAETATKIDTNPGWGLYNKLGVPSERDKVLGELGLAKTPSEIQETDMVGRYFTSYESAELFYRIYSAAMGFGMRKGALRLDVRGEPINRTWLCCKEGHRMAKYLHMPDRVRTARGITREGCTAKLRINKCKKTRRWAVRAFNPNHSHQLASRPWVQFMRDKRKVTDGALTTVRSLRSSGIKTTKIMSYIAQQVGGYDNVRFLAKDLYNNLGRESLCAIADGDAERAIGYLQSKADIDVDFYGKFSYDDKSRLMNMFWADSQARSDYARFGEVLSFDTTYKTNMYGKPLLVFVGVNNHFRSTIFACAILVNEVADTYVWALTTFLDCMKGDAPQAVITDGDLAMRAAILEVMPNAVHIICAWHIENNLMAHVKDPSFLPVMKKLMSKQYAWDEFERKWTEAIEAHNLVGNTYLQQMFSKREQWAETYLRTTFFAGMTTTQRCKKMNSVLKSRVTRHMTLVDFLRGIDFANSWMRHRQGEDEYKSFWKKPVPNVSNMPSIEKTAVEIYTPTMFYKVQHELKREGKYFVTKLDEADGTVTVMLGKYGDTGKSRVVNYFAEKQTYHCECNLMITKGYPCRHIFCSMKAMHITIFPPSLVVSRWKRDMEPAQGRGRTDDVTCNSKFSRSELRFGYVSSKCSEMAALAAKSEEAFEMATNALAALTGELRSMFARGMETSADGENTAHVGTGMKNPTFSSTKGGWMGSKRGGKGKKKCSMCHRPGHNRATCGTQQGQSNDEARLTHSKSLENNSYAPVSPRSQDFFGDDMATFSYSPTMSNVDVSEDLGTTAVLERIGKGWWGNAY